MNQPVAIPTNAEEIPAGRTGAASDTRGEPVGTTSCCTMGNEGFGRTNRDDSLEERGEGSSFEEVASLLLRGARPRAEPGASKARLGGLLRGLPPKLTEVLEQVPDEGNSMVDMDLLRAGRSSLGTLEPEGDLGRQTDTPTSISPPRVPIVGRDRPRCCARSPGSPAGRRMSRHSVTATDSFPRPRTTSDLRNAPSRP